ncbi:MAG: hypothetical protein QM811_04900 [Pirellulales bacterium]
MAPFDLEIAGKIRDTAQANQADIAAGFARAFKAQGCTATWAEQTTYDLAHPPSSRPVPVWSCNGKSATHSPR